MNLPKKDLVLIVLPLIIFLCCLVLGLFVYKNRFDLKADRREGPASSEFSKYSPSEYVAPLADDSSGENVFSSEAQIRGVVDSFTEKMLTVTLSNDRTIYLR